MRDWAHVLVDAGIRDLRPAQVAKEQNVTLGTVAKATRNYGLRLKGQRFTAMHPSRPQMRRLRPDDWRKELAFAATHAETLNDFCARVGCGPFTATRQADRIGHVFPSQNQRKALWWRRQFALAEAGRENLNDFCRRTNKSAASAKQWATKLGHTFQPQPSNRSKAARNRAKVPAAPR